MFDRTIVWKRTGRADGNVGIVAGIAHAAGLILAGMALVAALGMPATAQNAGADTGNDANAAVDEGDANPDREGAENGHVDAERLDELFAKLADTGTAEEARRVANEIWQVWRNPTTPSLASKMESIAASQFFGDDQQTIELLTNIIGDYPAYAEAWNQRATLYFQIGNFEASLEDVEEVLKREPRHFGALAGKAVILKQLGEDERARRAIIEGLKYHPFLRERGLFPELFDQPTQI